MRKHAVAGYGVRMLTHGGSDERSVRYLCVLVSYPGDFVSVDVSAIVIPGLTSGAIAPRVSVGISLTNSPGQMG